MDGHFCIFIVHDGSLCLLALLCIMTTLLLCQVTLGKLLDFLISVRFLHDYIKVIREEQQR